MLKFIVLLFIAIICGCHGSQIDFNEDSYLWLHDTPDCTCIVPYGIPFSIAPDIKRKLSAHNDPDIARFASIIDKHLIENFLNYMAPYNNTQLYRDTWNGHLYNFLDDYYEKVPSVTLMILNMFEGGVIDKSLKAIICK